MDDIKVLGLTSSTEFFIGSKNKRFRISEYLIVKDEFQGDLVFEVVESNTFNRFMPLNMEGDFVDSNVLESLRQIGYIVDDETIYIAKGRLLHEANFPVETGSKVREPEFDEIKKYLIHGNLDNSLVIGSIKNTDNIYNGMENGLKNLYYKFEEEIKIQEEVPFLYNIIEMNQYPHIGIFGGSGSGKSYGIRVLIEEIMKKEIPTIIFDPHYEMEFNLNPDIPADNISYEENYNIYKVGEDMGIDFKELNSRELKKLLNATSELTDAMDSSVDLLYNHFGKKGVDIESFEILLSNLIEMRKYKGVDRLKELYEDSVGEEKSHYETLIDLYEQYSNQVNEKSLIGINWRLYSLKNEGVFLKNSDEILTALKQGKTCVIRGSQRILQIYSSYILNKLYSLRRNYKDRDEEYFPPFLIITDEAHEFSPKSINRPSKQIIREIAQEGRKYGVFLVLATQRPTLLDETVTAQLNSKFIFRTVRATDIQTIKEETDISSEDAKRLPYLKTGDMFASVASVGRTIFSRIRMADTIKPDLENPFDELIRVRKQDDEDFFNIIKKYLPINNNRINDVIKELEDEGYRYSAEKLISNLDFMEQKGYITTREDFMLGKEYILKKE